MTSASSSLSETPPFNEKAHEECGQPPVTLCNIFGDSSQGQSLGHEWVIHYIRIPTSHTSNFKLGWVFALFPWFTQYRPAKSIATIVYFDTPQLYGDEWPGVVLTTGQRGCFKTNWQHTGTGARGHEGSY